MVLQSGPENNPTKDPTDVPSEAGIHAKKTHSVVAFEAGFTQQW